MSCPLSHVTIGEVVERMGDAFTTLDFIAGCPSSGGTKSGEGCPVVRSRKSRAVCGRSLADWQGRHPNKLMKKAQRSPARWEKSPSASQFTAEPPPPTASPPEASPPRRKPSGGWSVSMRQHQVRWKEDTAGIAERGEHAGSTRDFLFPRAAWAQNLLAPHRDAVLQHVEREDIGLHTFAHHVLSSQCFAFNLAGPFLEYPEQLTGALRRLLPPAVAAEVASVSRVELEYDGDDPGFGEPSHGRRGENRTSVDIAVWWEDRAGGTNLVLVEVKFTEAEFGGCGKGAKHRGRCNTDGEGLVRGRGRGCPLTESPHNRTYWALADHHGLFQWDTLAAQPACPFRHGGYQLMRNQLLARVLEADRARGLRRVDFAALVHDENPSIRRVKAPMAGRSDVDTGWRGVLTDPSRFHFWLASDWLGQAPDTPELGAWHGAMRERYFPMASGNGATVAVAPPEAATRSARKNAVVAGHRKCVASLNTPELHAYMQRCDAVVGRGRIYFRATGSGVVQIVLDAHAPGFVGFRTSADDRGYLLRPGGALPGESELADRWRDFQRWLPSVRRESAEEQAVIRWLHQALCNQLRLPELGEGWVFLNQEWRFLDAAGKGKKSDVLAVHLPSGKLGIVECKDEGSKRDTAVEQLEMYAQAWARDNSVLAPFFTQQLRAMGRLHGSVGATSATGLSLGTAAQFFAWPHLGGMAVERVR